MRESTIAESFFSVPAGYFLATSSTVTCMSLLIGFRQETSQDGNSRIDL